MSQSGTNLASYYTPSRFGYANWYDENKDEVPQAYEVGDLFYSTPFVNNICPVEGTPDVKFDPHYNTPYLDELTLMFEKALSDDLSVSLTGFLKKNKNIAFDVDSNGDLKSVNTGIMPDGTLETKDNWMYTGTTQVGGTNVPTYQQIVQPVGSYYYNKEKAYDRYTALQLLLSKKFSNKWMANFSFTYQDWKRYRFEDEEFNLNNFDFFNEGVVAPTSTGSGLDGMFINSRWMAKFTGMYQLPWGINLVTFFQAREGNPQPLRRSVILNQGNVQLYREGYKLGDERLPTFWMLNLGLEKTLKVTDTVTATLVLDWYNATNNQIELKHNLSIGGDPPGDPKPIMWSNAGLFQFGVRVNF
jgi:hypothetical protein